MSPKRSYSYLLSTNDALHFVKDTLGIDEFDKNFKCDKLKTLNHIIQQFLSMVPFHNATLLSVPISERIAPTVEENVHFCLSTEGGLGWTLNSSMCILLDALGFQVYPALASVAVSNEPNHIILMVKHLVEDGDTFLVDVGFGRPHFEAVNMNFDKESKLFHHSFDEFKYVKRGKEIIRLQKIPHNDPLGLIPVVEGKFSCGYYFNMDPFTFSDIRLFENLNVFENPSAVGKIFRHRLHMIRFPEGRAVAINDDILLTEQDNGKLKAEPITNMEETISMYFPMVPRGTVESMLITWRRDIEMFL